jgi:hypothetical protein
MLEPIDVVPDLMKKCSIELRRTDCIGGAVDSPTLTLACHSVAIVSQTLKLLLVFGTL